MRGLEQTGAVTWIDRHALALVQDGSRWSAAAVVSGVMAVLSNLISNVPAVMLWRENGPPPPPPPLLWGGGAGRPPLPERERTPPEPPHSPFFCFPLFF